MMEFLQALEASGFSMFVKESSTAYVATLAFHTIGLSFLVGVSTVTALRILGVAPNMPLQPMEDFFPLMYLGFWINLVTGTVLMCLYPTDQLTEPTIYIKLSAVVAAILIIRKIRIRVFGGELDLDTPQGSKKAKTLAAALLAVWLIATTTGRVMAYTIPTKLQTAGAVLVFITLALVVGYAIGRSLGWFKSTQQSA